VRVCVCRCVLFSDDETQLLTCGTDRKISYWDAYDGELGRRGRSLPAKASGLTPTAAQ
jgi:WD40 repeat protein